jgi:transcriptional regulator with XRE-family HTH domain
MPKIKTLKTIEKYAAKQLLEARKLRGLTQEQLGKTMLPALSAQRIHKFESCYTRMTLAKAYDFSRALELPISWFIPNGEKCILPKNENITDEEIFLLDTFRNASKEKKQAILTILQE